MVKSRSRVKNTKMHEPTMRLRAKKYNKTGNKQGPWVTEAKNETYIRPRVSWMLSTPRLSAKMTLMSAAIPPRKR